MSDLISREALKRAIMTECNPYGKPTIDYESGKKVLKIIDKAPTITPQALINGIVEIINNSGITTMDELLEALKKGINNAPAVNPCKNCDLYFKAMTIKSMREAERND